MSTFSAKPADVVHEWFVIDATDKAVSYTHLTLPTTSRV